MDALGIAVGVILIAILAIAGISLPDNFARTENINFFYLVLAVMAGAVSIMIYREMGQ